MTITVNRWLAFILVVMTTGIWSGCSRPSKDLKSEEFFTQWLQAHGETNIVADAYGVGIAGNPTRLRWSLYGTEQPTNGTFNAELEFRIRIPDQREIAGRQAAREAKETADDALATPARSHADALPVPMGDTMTRGQTTNSAPDMFPFRNQFREILAAQPLSSQAHWIKIIYANHRSRMMMCAVTMDNEDSPALTEAVSKLPWPKPEEFYMVKQFIVVK